MEARRKMEDYRAGVVAAVTANVMGGKKEDGSGWGPADFFDLGEMARPQQSEEERMEKLKALFRGMKQRRVS